ncbi:MAG TPA: hypothetical protein VFZ78_07690 [Flavisolibacter sp.]
MKIEITHDTRICDIQDAFRLDYPFLKLEFFPERHKWGEHTQGKYLDHSLYVYQVTGSIKDVTITLLPWLRTGVVEQMFQDKLGMPVQVFRRQGERWIETAGTDELSLFEQNETGRKSLSGWNEVLWVERAKFMA